MTQISIESDQLHPISWSDTSQQKKLEKVLFYLIQLQNSKGISPNYKLLAKPDLLDGLVAVLHRFRAGRFAASTDIEKISTESRFHQTITDALRLSFRFDPAGG